MPIVQSSKVIDGSIKSIQRGTGVLSASGFASVTIAPVHTSRTELRLLTGGSISIYLENATTIQCNGNSNQQFSWELTEFL